MIEIENLYKNYGNIQALRGISLSIPKGQILGLLGPNGAGKSTTLRILTGFLEPSSGCVRIGGKLIHEEPIQTRKQMGYLPESTPLYEQMLVYDYLHFIGRSRSMSQDECLKKIHQVGERCDITSFIGRPIGDLSKGQRQRVGLAMAILDDPEVLVLDEPTSGLDPNQIIGIRKIIKEIGREKTIIFSTHILSEAEATCDRVVIINEGEIAADGTIAELQNNAGGVLKLSLDLSDAPASPNEVEAIFSALESVSKVRCSQTSQANELELIIEGTAVQELRTEIKKLVKKQDWFLLGIESQKSLEDIFRRLTT